jgi:hypothetical protein
MNTIRLLKKRRRILSAGGLGVPPGLINLPGLGIEGNDLDWFSILTIQFWIVSFFHVS